jgi:hypothetical protein
MKNVRPQAVPQGGPHAVGAGLSRAGRPRPQCLLAHGHVADGEAAVPPAVPPCIRMDGDFYPSGALSPEAAPCPSPPPTERRSYRNPGWPWPPPDEDGRPRPPCAAPRPRRRGAPSIRPQGSRSGTLLLLWPDEGTGESQSESSENFAANHTLRAVRSCRLPPIKSLIQCSNGSCQNTIPQGFPSPHGPRP